MGKGQPTSVYFSKVVGAVTTLHTRHCSIACNQPNYGIFASRRPKPKHSGRDKGFDRCSVHVLPYLFIRPDPQ